MFINYWHGSTCKQRWTPQQRQLLPVEERSSPCGKKKKIDYLYMSEVLFKNRVRVFHQSFQTPMKVQASRPSDFIAFECSQ